MAIARKIGRQLKDPDSIIDITFDWSDWLVSGDTISASAWAVSQQDLDDDGAEQAATDATPLTAASSPAASNTTTTTTFWADNGTPGTIYRLRNRITTASSRVEDRTVEVEIVQR